MNIKEYIILECDNAEDLQELVNAAILDDFEPIGGVSVCAVFQFFTDYTYTQAMIKYFDSL